MNGRNAIGQVFVALSRHQEARVLDHSAKFLLARETCNALHQILVAIPIACHQLTNQGDSAKAPALVNSIKQRVLHLAELEASKHATGLEHAERLLERNILVCEIANAKSHRVQVDALAGYHVQILGVCFDKVKPRRARVRRLERALFALSQHVRVDVGDGDACVNVVVDVRGVVEHAESNVACATCDVQDVHAPVLG